MDTKICTRCMKEKPIAEFYRAKRTKYHRHCKWCVSKQNKEQWRKTKQTPPVRTIPPSRKCIVCHTEKPSAEFRHNRTASDGLYHTCKSCMKHPPSAKAQVCRKCNMLKPATAFCRNADHSTGLSFVCKECNHLHYAETSEVQFEWSIKGRYGITIDEYNQMLREQKGVCALCGKPETSGARGKTIRRLSVDHDHSTGMPRALLCSHCNAALGNLNDDPSLCERAAVYLRKHQERGNR